MRPIFVAALAVLSIVFSSNMGQGGSSPLQRSAEIAFAGGQFEYAYVQWKKLLENGAKNPVAVEGLLKIEGVARDLFEESLMLQAASPEKAKEELMTVLLITDPWSELNREARTLLEGGPSYVNHTTYRSLAELLQESPSISSLRENVARLQKIAVRYPNSPVPHYLMGRALEASGDARGAVRQYQEAIKIRGNCAPCREALGQTVPTIP